MLKYSASSPYVLVTNPVIFCNMVFNMYILIWFGFRLILKTDHLEQRKRFKKIILIYFPYTLPLRVIKSRVADIITECKVLKIPWRSYSSI